MLPKLDGVVYSQTMLQLIFLNETNTAGLLRISESTGHLGRCKYVDENAAKEVGESPYLGVVGESYESVPVADLE